MILNVLRDAEVTVAAVALKLGIALGTVSPQLLMMKRQGVLLAREQGNQVFFRLANPKMLQAFDLIRELLYEQVERKDHLTRHLRRERARNARQRKRRRSLETSAR